MIACLDTQFWVGTPQEDRQWFEKDKENMKEEEKIPGEENPSARNKTILYQFYKKPMANKLSLSK